MVGIGILSIIFIMSLLWVGLILRSLSVAHTLNISAPTKTKIEMLRELLETVPFFVWTEGQDGQIWANRLTKNSLNKIDSTAFSFSNFKESKNSGRIGHITLEGNQSSAFHIFNHRLDGVKHYFAFPKKDDNLSNQFVQTMSVTFAQLQIGIAAFDRRNELSLFNPALTEHLGLRPEWLLKKPNLLSFLDRLRDTKTLPEPKDYTSWRKTFLRIERSAMKDDYCEDWELPDGRSLRVIGRPHPSGSVVFLFEDVTAILEMERHFRSQVGNLQNILDATSVGLAVFDRNGNAIYLNEPLQQALPHENTLRTVQDFSRILQQHFKPTPIWGDMRQFMEETIDRSPWQADAETIYQERILIRFEPISNGDTLCEFHFPAKINLTNGVGLACASQ
jgi:PAS domain-containing protein